MENTVTLLVATGVEEPLSPEEIAEEIAAAQVTVEKAMSKAQSNGIALHPGALAQAQSNFRFQALFNALIHKGVLNPEDMELEFARVQAKYFEDSVNMAVTQKVAETLAIPAMARQKLVTVRK